MSNSVTTTNWNAGFLFWEEPFGRQRIVFDGGV